MVGFAVPIPTFPNLSTISEVAVDDPTVNAGEPASELTESCANGVDVAIAIFPPKRFCAVVEAIIFPTVSCVPVAISVVPAESETMIEFGANDVELVPPLATGRVPVTPVVRET